MAMNLDELDVLDDIEDVEVEEPVVPAEPAQEPEEEEVQDPQVDENDDDHQEDQPEEDAIQQFLKTKGIVDVNKIKFENDEGEIEEVSWNDLSEEEKLNILNTDNDSESDTDLDDSEIDLINRLRLSGMSVQEYLDSVKQQGAAEYAKTVQQQQEENYSYTVDDLTDEELYVLDLQARIEDISDEECKEALDRAMSNETLFKKEIAGLREDYKRLEDQRNEQNQALQLQQQQEQFEKFSNGIIAGINNFNSIGQLNVDMNDDDKNQLYQFITGVDNAGVNHFAKALQDPDTAVRMAWFALHGEDIINSISEYYNQQIQEVAKTNYEKGKNEAKAKVKPEKKVVVKKQPKVETRNIKSIDDLD